ncbi:methyltransferase domain-containing protein [Nitratireductor sp. PBL-C9]|uniref:class I SAM-dependent methyltransferase n=1 Tax=Nitratireductor sp. PBL-C9 TaxID=3435013 RepID=UPI003D7C73A0
MAITVEERTAKKLSPSEVIKQAKEAEAAQNDELAASLFSQAIDLKGATSPAWWYVRLAHAHIRLGNRQAAVEAYRCATAIEPTHSGWVAAAKELDKWSGSRVASAEASADYYDEVYRQSEAYRQAAGETPYAAMWSRILQLLQAARTTHILDIGCGPGQFATFLNENWNGDYEGLDFSKVAIDQANSLSLPYKFYYGNALTSDALSFSTYDTVICTEVLEHIDEDIELLKRIRSNVYCLCSVPSFHAFGHVRYFTEAGEVVDRYSPLFTSIEIEEFPLPSGAKIFLISGRRCGD